MLLKILNAFFILSLFLLSIGLNGQPESPGLTDSLIVQQFEEAENDLFLLRNEMQLIPLQNLETLGLKSMGVGAKAENPFNETLAKYTSVVRLVFDSKNDISRHFKTTENTLTVLHLHLDEIFEPGENTIEAIRSLIQNPSTITVVFDERGILNHFPIGFEKSGHLIYVGGKSEFHQSLAAQLIFGGVGTHRQLGNDLNEHFKKGEGLHSPGGLRLRYSPPQVLGMDARLLRDSIGAIAKMGIDSGAFPGCQVLVAKNGHVVFHETWGFHTYDKKQPVRPTDLYDFASITKVTSALPALMKLYGEGRFDLEAPFKKYYPAFKNSDKAQLRMRDILAHQSRLKAWIPYWRSTLKKNGKYKCRTFKTKPSRRYPVQVTDKLYLHRHYKKKIFKAIKKSPLNAEQGYVYSDLSFYLFPEIVSDLVNEDFETYLKNTFYKPLGAYTITYNPYPEFPPERIIPTENDTFFRMVQIHGKVHDEGAVMMGGVSGHAGLFGTANDLAKLMQMYLNGGTYGGQRFIAREALDEFTRCQFCYAGNRRGLGFDKPLIEYHPVKSSVAKDASPRSFGHAGYTGTFVWVDPEYDLIYIFFSNRVYPTRENRKIYDMNIRPTIHQVIYDSFLK